MINTLLSQLTFDITRLIHFDAKIQIFYWSTYEPFYEFVAEKGSSS